VTWSTPAEPPRGGGTAIARERLSREARRNAILDAATDVFGQMGFESTRMDDVAKAAGIAKGLLYKHFPSKDALFEALIDRQGRAYAAELRGALQAADASSKPFDALRAGLALWLRTVGDQRASFNVTDPGIHDGYDNLREGMRDVIAESIRAAEPAIEDPYPRLIAALIQGAAENFGLVWRTKADSMPQDQALDILAAFCWGGVSALQNPDGPATA
jgi:AcrR family transcriptional regulator